MSVALIVPWRGGCSHRELVWDWLRARYRREHPDWSLIVGGAPRDQPWVKASAVNSALARCSAEIVVVADADVWTEGIPDAVEAVRNGSPWAVPHRDVYRLVEHSTTAFLAGMNWMGLELTEPPYPTYWGGGVVVAPRETILDIPLDPRFVGWGQEDHAWGMALTYLAGTAWRGSKPLIHLWHPPQERMQRRFGSLEGKRLWQRYLRARSDPRKLRDLIEEAKRAARDSAQPALHDLPA